MDKVDYNEIFQHAKQNTVYAHAMVWIKEIANTDKGLDSDKFKEIKEVVFEAIKHLENVDDWSD